MLTINDMQHLNKFLAALAMVLFMVSCETFFEEDISNDSIVLLIPGNDVETEVASQNFWWDKLEGATKYRLQVVTPGFSNGQVLVVDTLVSDNRFVKTLYPGRFEWRVRGENSAYHTEWSNSRFVIVATDDLTRQVVKLSYPGNDHFTNQTKIRFSWDALYNADQYQIEFYKGQWGVEPLVEPKTTTDPHIELVLAENEISWGVKALNDKSETQFAQRRLIIDLTPPVKPTLTAPDSLAQLSKAKVLFSWNSSDKTWTKVTDSLFLSKDKGMVDLVEKRLVLGKQTEVELSLGFTYYWKVKSYDQAGNASPWSDTSQFTLGE